MSLSSLGLDVAAPVNVTILNPKTRQPIRDTEGKEAFITLVSPDHPDVQKVQKAAINKRLKARGRAPNLTADELEAERAETLVAATKGWYLVNFDGSPINVPFNESVAREVYTKPEFSWLREQVSEAFDDRATFL
jgi:hypothetical protein